MWLRPLSEWSNLWLLVPPAGDVQPPSSSCSPACVGAWKPYLKSSQGLTGQSLIFIFIRAYFFVLTSLSIWRVKAFSNSANSVSLGFSSFFPLPWEPIALGDALFPGSYRLESCEAAASQCIPLTLVCSSGVFTFGTSLVQKLLQGSWTRPRVSWRYFRSSQMLNDRFSQLLSACPQFVWVFCDCHLLLISLFTPAPVSLPPVGFSIHHPSSLAWAPPRHRVSHFVPELLPPLGNTSNRFLQSRWFRRILLVKRLNHSVWYSRHQTLLCF